MSQGYSAPPPPAPPVVRDRWNLFYPLLVALAAVWIGIGRAFLGSGGWLLMFLAPVVPVMLIYAGIASSIINALAKDAVVAFDARLRALSVASVAMLFVFGFTVVDFGDSTDSVTSVLSQSLRVLGFGADTSTIVNVSGLLALTSGTLGVVLTLIVWVGLARRSSQHAATLNRPLPVWRTGPVPRSATRRTPTAGTPPPNPNWPPPPPPPTGQENEPGNPELR
jgi:hypothetical protein